ncbi:sigma-54 dependent transcriptional regulator [Puia sp.]|jgi:DNA-binding NtrC family response regulator|uniref:sigma-54-dependent transcriptional regulator n=1 Tax=Puia sp. TaxID=2045100 RepID=UPI002F3F0650
MAVKIMIVEDQFIEASSLRAVLRKAGYLVCSIASSVNEAIKIVDLEKPEIVLLDIHLQGKSTGIDLARILQTKKIAFVYLSANFNARILDEAKATRPYGFLVKPFRENDVLVTLDVARYLHQQDKEPPAISSQGSGSSADFKEMVGSAKSINKVIDHILIAGPSDISVLILGESGTGKELVARCIHRTSARKTQPFIVVNCAALPPNLVESELFGHEKGAFTGALEKRTGKFEQGDNGTIFLDEVGELPIDMQVKLLRVLQEREVEPIGGKKKKVNVRIIAATNRRLEDEVAAGRFRLDLYYRLNVFPIPVPSLRERKEDIPVLAAYFLGIYAKKENRQITGLSEHVINALQSYSWPGNVRELENIIARTVLLTTGPLVDKVELPFDPVQSPTPGIAVNVKTITENERDYIVAILNRCNGKVNGADGAAQLMNIPPSTLKSRMKKLGIARKSKYL